MAIIHVTEATVGAPNSGRISGTNGDLYAMLKYALPLNGWAVEYDDAVNFAAVFRAATGNRFRLYVNDHNGVSGSAALALVRGCENATGATTADLVDPFPTVAAVANANANWIKSNGATATARAFDIWVGETFVIYAVNMNGSSNVWELHFFGDFAPSLPGDSYNTVCTTRDTTSAASNNWATTAGWLITAITSASSRVWLCRTYDGTVKSVRGGVSSKLGGLIGQITGMAAAMNGPSTGIDTEKIVLVDSGSSTTTATASLCLSTRGWLPNILYPQHNGRGSINTRDEYTETPLIGTGKIVTQAASTNGPFAVIQESDDWTPP